MAKAFSFFVSVTLWKWSCVVSISCCAKEVTKKALATAAITDDQRSSKMCGGVVE